MKMFSQSIHISPKTSYLCGLEQGSEAAARLGLSWGSLPFQFPLERQQRPFDNLPERGSVGDLAGVIPRLFGFYDLMESIVGARRDAGIEENGAAGLGRSLDRRRHRNWIPA